MRKTSTEALASEEAEAERAPEEAAVSPDDADTVYDEDAAADDATLGGAGRGRSCATT